MVLKKVLSLIHTRVLCVRNKSLREASLMMLIPLLLMMAAFLLILFWGTLENRKLAGRYIQDTASLYVELTNKSIYQINRELIILATRNEYVRNMPDDMEPSDGKYYDWIQTIKTQNSTLAIRYEETDTFFVFGRSAEVYIDDEGTCFRDSIKTELKSSVIDLMYEKAREDSVKPQWDYLLVGRELYAVGWYARNQRAVGCVIRMSNILNTLEDATQNYRVIPFIRLEDGMITTTEEVFKIYDGEFDADKDLKGQIFSYPLSNLGEVNLYVLPSGGIQENLMRMQIVLITMVIVLVIICTIVFRQYYFKIMEPIKRFADGLEALDEEQMLNDDGFNSIVELQSVNEKFRELLRKIQSLKIAIYEKELMKQKTELEYAQEQMKPHFFLNCLSLIHAIADSSGEKDILHITEVLSDYLRYIFKDSGGQRTIEEELTHVLSYVEIQKLRYGENAFDFADNIDEDARQCKIPSLLLQILVENAFVHELSMDNSIEISLYVTFETFDDGKYLYICVSDTGKGFSTEILDAIEKDRPIIYNGRKHVGLQNIRRRLALIYGKQASIVFSNMDDGYGAIVEVRIPQMENV